MNMKMKEDEEDLRILYKGSQRHTNANTDTKVYKIYKAIMHVLSFK